MCLQIEEHLKKQSSTSGWFAGEGHPTAADFMMIYCLETLDNRSTVGPSVKAYIKRVHKSPAFQRVSVCQLFEMWRLTGVRVSRRVENTLMLELRFDIWSES